MTAATYMSQLAQQLGCIYVPKCTTFKSDYQSNQKGAVFGARQGYLVALALTAAGRSTGFAILVRYPKSAAAEQIQESLKNRPGFSKFLAKKTVKASADGVAVSWTYALNKTKMEEVVSLLDAVIQEVSRYAPAFTGKCEDCATADTRGITLMNGTPGYHCVACQMRIAAEKQREADEYKAKEANYAGGLAAGLAAVAITGSAWGWLVSWMEADSGQWSPKLHAVVAFGISIPVAWLIFKAMGKRDRAGQALAVVLTLAAKWWGDAIYYTHVLMHFQNLAFSWQLVGSVLRHFFDFKFLDVGHKIVAACDVGISLLVPWMPWGKLPKFVPVFQTVNPDGSLTQTLAQSAGAR
jgi:hypothetical protein